MQLEREIPWSFGENTVYGARAAAGSLYMVHPSDGGMEGQKMS